MNYNYYTKANKKDQEGSKIKKLSILFLLCFSVIFAETDQKGEIVIKIRNIRNNKGKIFLKLCQTKGEFKEKKDSKKMKELKIENNESSVIFKNLKYGKYAVIVLHDENNNKKMDKNILRMPKEGYGSSNNKIKMGPPNFEKSLFSFENNSQEININMVYIGRKE